MARSIFVVGINNFFFGGGEYKFAIFLIRKKKEFLTPTTNIEQAIAYTNIERAVALEIII